MYVDINVHMYTYCMYVPAPTHAHRHTCAHTHTHTHTHLVWSQTPKNYHLLEVSQLFIPRFGQRSLVRFSVIVQQLPLISVSCKEDRGQRIEGAHCNLPNVCMSGNTTYVCLILQIMCTYCTYRE